MEFLTPAYRLLLELRHRIECGHSVSEALKSPLVSGEDEFSTRLRTWLVKRERGTQRDPIEAFSSPLQGLLVETLDRGLGGEPILPRLAEIEEEMRLAMEDCIERHLQRLPVLMLLPLAGLIFPSFLLLLLGPLVGNLLRSLVE